MTLPKSHLQPVSLMFFNSWQSLYRLLIVGILAYIILIVFLRLTGKRTLSKMNAFDLVITVSLGSTLATALLNKDVSLADGALAFGLLTGLQFVVTWSSVRMRWIRQLVTGEPHMLFYRGQLLHDELMRARITEDELHAGIRNAGILSLAEVEAVVIETDGSLSVIPRQSNVEGPTSLDSIANNPSPGA